MKPNPVKIVPVAVAADTAAAVAVADMVAADVATVTKNSGYM